ncbi:hypothetical protein L7F22_008770 [Adiantum nelumboides]|nr:hypothetical protein [Adiantum nelumboides]
MGHQKYYAKLAKRYYGPFQILKPINEMAYQLKLPNHWLIHNAFHVGLLKPYKGKPPKEAIMEDPPEVESQEEELQPEFVLRHEDKILRHGKIIRCSQFGLSLFAPLFFQELGNCCQRKATRNMEKAAAFVLILSVLAPHVSGNPAFSFYGLDSVLSQAHIDPSAQNDSFLSLSSSQRRFLGQSGTFDTQKKIDSLLTFETTVPISIKLVGFSNEDRLQLEDQFSHYIDVVSRDEKVKVVGGDAHELVVLLKPILTVEPTTTTLANTIYNAISKQLEKPSSLANANLKPVDYSVIDAIIKEDLSKPLKAYTIYLLNLQKQKHSYAYSYNWREPSASVSRCLGSLWTGGDRYMWIDLAAGPVEYGPALSGEGLLPRGDAHPLATLHSNRQGQKAFMADLASLVWSATQMLLAPSIRVPMHFETDMDVHFIHIRGSEEDVDSRGLDWNLIESTFSEESRNGLLLSTQHLKFYTHAIKMSSCSVCMASVSRAMRSYTSRFHFENYTLIVSDYLDSKQLHWALRHSRHELLIKAGITHSSAARVVPVYVFDLDQDRHLLLDRYHQAIAFRDMVIAVRTRSSHGVSDYTCNGRHVVLQSRQLERPIVGALLQTLWGVTPTHLRWSAQHNNSIVDYTWSVGQTPFGPFSDMLSLSFVQKDAAPRNTLLITFNNSVSSAIEVLRSAKAHGGERKLLGAKRHAEFMQRWHVFYFKLEKVMSSISHFDFDTALYFMKSTDHDLLRLHRLLYEAATEVQTTLVCFSDPPFPWKPILGFGCILIVVVYLWMKREKLFYNKKKQF